MTKADKVAPKGRKTRNNPDSESIASSLNKMDKSTKEARSRKAPPIVIAKSATTLDDDSHLMVLALISDFCNGSSIERAAQVFQASDGNINLILALLAAALVPRKLVVNANQDAVLIKGGFSLGDGKTYNHSLARIAGNMILEANETDYRNGLISKIGGKSMLTPDTRKLKKNVADIYDSNKAKFDMITINKYLPSFVINGLNDSIKSAKRGDIIYSRKTLNVNDASDMVIDTKGYLEEDDRKQSAVNNYDDDDDKDETIIEQENKRAKMSDA